MNTNSGHFVDSDVNSSDSESVESDSSDEQVVAVKKNVTKPSSSAKSNVDLLLELDDCEFLKLLLYYCMSQWHIFGEGGGVAGLQQIPKFQLNLIKTKYELL